MAPNIMEVIFLLMILSKHLAIYTIHLSQKNVNACTHYSYNMFNVLYYAVICYQLFCYEGIDTYFGVSDVLDPVNYPHLVV